LDLDAIYPQLRTHAGAQLRLVGLDAGDAEDLVQEAFARWQAAVAEVQQPEAYLRRVIGNLAVEQQRRATGARRSRGRLIAVDHDALDEPHLSLSEAWARGGS
jgi:DNA-directed RNA polymerase specialized sigma24 family protein